ncbi:MAG: hypothetical protein RL653_543 [Pseudomonadota bacterium]|jgi:exonuclease V gamma subunit
MLRLVSSNSPAQLAAALAAELHAWREQQGPFAPAHVVVPHKALSEWLMNELSELHGAVLNLHRLSPQALTRTDDEMGLVGRIYAAFQDEAFLEEAAFVRQYVHGEPGGAAPAARARRQKLRALVLAQRTAALFRSYREQSPGFPELDECPAWQRLLWKRVVVESSARAVPELPRLFLFDVAAPAEALLREVKRRADAGCEVTVFVRVAAPVPLTLEAPVLDEALDSVQAVLAAWRGLGAVEEPLRVEPPGAAGVLGVLQSQLAGVEPPAGALSDPPPTLRFVNAPSIRRECEWVAADLWRAVKAHGLRFHEVAVVIPREQQDAYLPALGAAFQEAHQVPRVEWEGALTRTSRVARAARELLDLPLGTPGRAQLVSLLTHPALCSLYEEAEPAEWETWLDAVGIFHGAHAGDHAGTYLEDTQAANWDQGLRRLALGAFLAGERSGAEGWFRGNTLVEERTQSQQGSVATLLRLARSLVADAHFLRRAELPVSEWTQVLRDYLAVHLQPTTKGSLEERGAVLRAVSGLSAFGAAGAVVPYEWIHALAVGALEGLTGQGLGRLTQGVVVGSPESLRGVPFRYTYVLGMEAGAIPVRDRGDELDARPVPPASARLASCAAFVDLLSLSREGLVLSRMARDPLTGEERAASTLFHETREWVDRRAGAPGLAEALSTRTPLLRAHAAASDAGFATAFPEAHAEALALEWGAHARKAVGDFRSTRDLSLPQKARTFLKSPDVPPAATSATRPRQVSLDALRRFLECPVDGYARFAFRMSPLGEDRSRMEDEPFDLPFLEANGLLPLLVEEVMFSGDVARLAQDEQALFAFVHAAQAREWAKLAARGQVPLGRLSQVQQEHNAWNAVYTAQRVLGLTGEAPPGKPDICRFGRPEKPTERGTLRPSLPLAVQVGAQEWKVELVGRTRLLLEESAFIVQPRLDVPPELDSDGMAKACRYVLRNWVDHLALCAAGNSRDRTLVLAGRAGPAWMDLRFDAPALSAGEATSLLQGFVAPLLDAPARYRLPFHPLVAYRFGDEPTSLTERFAPDRPDAEQQLSGLHEDIEEHYSGHNSRDRLARQAVRQVGSLPDPTSAEAFVVAQRLEQFLSRCTLSKEDA